MSAATLLVIAKEPRPGFVKTRLQQRFSAPEAASLAAASLADSLVAVAAARADRRVVVLDGAPGPWLPPGFEVAGQGDGGLDARLEHAFAGAFGVPAPRRSRRAVGPVLLIGMDTPQVTPAQLTPDWGTADAVLGLCPDGGFWAVGFRRHVPGAFIGVPMSTPSTGADQLARLRSLGLRVRLLPELQDVDTPADADAVAALAPHTRFAARMRELDARSATPEHPLELYGAALDGLEVRVELADGSTLPLDVPTWSADADDTDRMLLNRCEGTVLDLGCGPGRLVGELAAQGTPALGIDICAGAVDRTAARGAGVLLRAVEGRLPAEGRWDTVLLADGNIGIGGDPEALLRRCGRLLRVGGLLLVEADADDDTDLCAPVRLVAAGRRSTAMPWARLGRLALARTAESSGFLVVEEWRAGGRVFLALRSLGASVSG